MPAPTTTEERVDEERDRAYTEGRRGMARLLLSQVIRELGAEDQAVAELIAERDATRAVLRRICGDHGDNDWPDDLHLADVIDKHLAPYLGD